MPLRAMVDGEPITGPDLSGEEWTALTARHKKGVPVTMECCGAPGHARKSGRGTQHFYHAVAAGCHYGQESPEHLEIKYQIYRICKSEHWETYVEFPASDRTWISDVCAVRDGRKIVFEIQLSPLAPADLEDRDARYRNEGIESYWLLDNFLERSRDCASWYHAYLHGEDDRPEGRIPYIDHALFETGPENHMFIAKGIRSAGLNAKKQTLFTTHNPAISLADWVREVLKGNYQQYLQDTAAACHTRRRLKTLAGPALIRFRDFYRTIIRDETYKETARHYERICKTGTAIPNRNVLQKKVHELYSEIDWLNTEYRSFMAEGSGLFYWKKTPEYAAPRPCFRLEPASNVKKLQECVKTLNQWEESFKRALRSLEEEIDAR